MFYLLLLLMLVPDKLTLVDFQKDIGTKWVNVDDVVMGGESQSKFTTDNSGNGVFYGVVSLENNGGFSSVRYRFEETAINQFQKAFIRIKGDGKEYQFRVKSAKDEKVSYKSHFQTSGDWETIEIDLRKMEPTWRGYTPDMPDFPGKTLSEIGFLIANKKAEQFELKIDRIWLE